MKKFILGLACAAMAVSAMAVSASAANVSGAKAYYTETEAFINDVPVQAFMVNNQTCVRTGELAAYGFNHQWDGNARAVYVSINTIPGVYNYVSQWNSSIRPSVFVNNSAYAGTLYKKSVPSDVKVYMNGTEVVSYHMGDEILVRLKDLVLAGEGINKYYDPVRNASWINVNALGVASTLNNANLPGISTREALDEALEFLATNYNSLIIPNSGNEWRAFYVDQVAGGFTFPVEDEKGVAVGSITVNYQANANVDQIVADGIFAWARSIYAK